MEKYDPDEVVGIQRYKLVYIKEDDRPVCIYDESYMFLKNKYEQIVQIIRDKDEQSVVYIYDYDKDIKIDHYDHSEN